jgi:hypothetical protein
MAPAGQLTDEERVLLSTPVAADVHRREGLLRCATGISVAIATALVVTRRIPEAGPIETGHLPGRTHPPHGSSADRGRNATRPRLAAHPLPWPLVRSKARTTWGLLLIVSLESCGVVLQSSVQVATAVLAAVRVQAGPRRRWHVYGLAASPAG